LFKISAAVLFLFLVTTWAAPAAVEPVKKTANEETRIVILHVNDAHCKIDNYPKIAWYVAQVKKKHPNVFFMNGGDNFSGNPVVDLYDPRGEPVRVLMNNMKYDVMVLGNHDFDYGQEILKRFIQKANYPIICANVKTNKAVLPQPEPFTILKTANGIKLAILGLVHVEKDTGIPSSHPDNVKGLVFSEPIETAKKYRFLEKDNHVFIALTHLGYDGDMKLAGEMGELDLIVGGHSHTAVMEPGETNGVLIVQAGGQANYVGQVEVIVKNGRVIKKSGRLINVSSIKETDPELEKMVAKYNDNPVLDRVVAELPYSPAGKFELGHLITDGLRKMNHLDIAFHNSGGIRSPKLNRTVRLKDIYSLHPFGNSLVRYEMTPAEIRSLLRFDYERNKRLDLKASGIQYTIKRTADFKVKEIEIETPDGKPLDESKTYSVGINDYISQTYGFTHKDPGKSLMVTLAENLTRYLKEGKDVCRNIKSLRTFEIIAAGDGMTPIGKTAVDLSAEQAVNSGSSTAGNLVTDAIRKASGADIATYPTRQLRVGLVIPASSAVYREHIASFYRYSDRNKAVVAGIKGKDLRQFLLERCRMQGYADLQVSGMTYALRFDSSGEVQDVTCKLPDGKEIENTALYRVAFNDYEFRKIYKLENKTLHPTYGKKTVEQMVSDYIKSVGTLTGSITSITEKRIMIIK
jgi:2',3'-cyclic-nucleotide 2'-phosphodiesterase (5'-nucleotidase family)